MTLQKNKIFIFDTNIFLTGIEFNVINGLIYATPSILNEIDVDKYRNKNRNILNRINAAIENKKLVIKQPIQEFISEVNEKAEITGDFGALSEPDKELIALALELIMNKENDVLLYTNDYSIQNVCDELKILFSSFLKNGIKKRIQWEVYCPHCKNVFPSDQLNKECEKCGLLLKRRPKM